MTGMSQTDNNNFSPLEQLKSDWYVIILIIATFAAAVYFYPQLPERVPSHWNVRGQVDGYSSRIWGAFGIPLMNAGIYLMMLFLPLIDPRRDNYVKFAGTYRLLRVVFVCFFTGLYVIIILAAMGYPISVDRLVPLGISLLFVFIGNYMGRIQHNYFVGIKVPWTLASEEVWRKTHRLAGPLWVIAGLLGIVGAMIGGTAAMWFLFVPLLSATVIPVVYSFLIYKQL